MRTHLGSALREQICKYGVGDPELIGIFGKSRAATVAECSRRNLWKAVLRIPANRWVGKGPSKERTAAFSGAFFRGATSYKSPDVSYADREIPLSPSRDRMLAAGCAGCNIDGRRSTQLVTIASIH